MGDSALVLTILESKGMEFDDVVLYNFFSGSENLASYRCLHLLLDTEARGLDVAKHAVSGFPPCCVSSTLTIKLGVMP